MMANSNQNHSLDEDLDSGFIEFVEPTRNSVKKKDDGENNTDPYGDGLPDEIEGEEKEDDDDESD